MAKKKKTILIENQDKTDIYIDYIRQKRLSNTKKMESVGRGASWAGAGTLLVMLDMSGFLLFTWLLFDDEINGAGKKIGRGIDSARLKRLGKKKISLNNHAGQEVRGKLSDVLSLMALQEELISLFREKEASRLRDNFMGNDRIGRIIQRIQQEAQEVEVEFGTKYKIIKSSDDIRKYDLRDQIAKSQNPDRKLLKTLGKRKK